MSPHGDGWFNVKRHSDGKVFPARYAVAGDVLKCWNMRGNWDVRLDEGVLLVNYGDHTGWYKDIDEFFTEHALEARDATP